MEIEGGGEGGVVVGKKVWKMVRVVLLMLRKGIAKSKVAVELHMMLKRGKSLVNSLMFHHYYNALTCRSHGPHPFISPRINMTATDYEFSCSNSPAIKQHRYSSSSNKKNKSSSSLSCQYDDVLTLSAVQKVLEMLNSNNNENSSSSSSCKASPSPLVTLPGFGKSPIGRQLRVTDSPFPLKDDDDADTQVDVAAEEFIKRFYKDLNLQKAMAADSPYHNYSIQIN